jgi:DNA-binding transcriptional LysR family regulator
MGATMNDRIGHRLKLRDLHILMTILNTGSMGKAAQRLNITQPNVSRAVADLEHTFGVRLLDRHPQGVDPTKYGRALVDCGLAVFDDLRQGVKNLEFLADPTAGEVRVGSIPPLAASFVSVVVDRLARRHPGIVFHLVAESDALLYRNLHERNVDFLLTQRVGPLADAELSFEKVYDDSYAVVAGVQNPWVRRRKVTLDELINEPWVLPSPDDALGAFFKIAFRAHGLDYPRKGVFTRPADTRISLLATGRYLSIFSPMMMKLKFANTRPQIKVLPVALALPAVPVGVFSLKNRTLSPVAQLFIEHARDVAEQLTSKR